MTNGEAIMGSSAPGQPLDAQENGEEANTEPATEPETNPVPLPAGDPSGVSDPESKFHG